VPFAGGTKNTGFDSNMRDKKFKFSQALLLARSHFDAKKCDRKQMEGVEKKT